MTILLIKSLLLFSGLLLQDAAVPTFFAATSFLCAVIISALCQYLNMRRFTTVITLSFFASGLLYPVLCPFMPMLCFDLCMNGKRKAALPVMIPLAARVLSGTAAYTDTALLTLLCLFAVVMQDIYEKQERLLFENKRIRDNGAEMSRMLAQKNEYLLENQNHEIHIATLKERNRIAREIHDNVGHIISRSILQTGAAQAVNKDKIVDGLLSGMKETLSQAMDGLRGSVHDLRDNSIDLRESVNKLLGGLPYETHLDYDAARDIPTSVKYCLISVLKESLTNISRHSDATQINVSVLEHPAMLQMLIHDNGSKMPSPDGYGMGLANMEERVKALGGCFSAGHQNGFRIFVSIPRQEEDADEDNSR